MKKMQYGGKSVPGSNRIKKDGKWVSISDEEKSKRDAEMRKKAENSVYRASKPVTILKGVNRRDEIGKPSSPMVLKSSTTSTPKPKSTPSKIRKPDSFSRKNIAKGLSAKSVGVKSSSPIGKTPEGAVKNVSLSRPSSTDSKSSASPLSKRATMKGLRKEKRSERKLSRQARRENRIINKTAKLKAKR